MALPTNPALVVIMPFLDPTPILPYACWLGQRLALGRAKEFAHTTKVLAPIALASTFFETINALWTLHPSSSNSFCLDSLMNFQPDAYLEPSFDCFRSTFMRLSHLSTRSPLSMVFVHFQDFFDLEDLAHGFIQLH